jgi:hypothetical protein
LSNKEEKRVNIKQIFDKKQFISGNKVEIDVSTISRGYKIVTFEYKTNDGFDRKAEKVLFTN